jgi:hypothetical protein
MSEGPKYLLDSLRAGVANGTELFPFCVGEALYQFGEIPPDSYGYAAHVYGPKTIRPIGFTKEELFNLYFKINRLKIEQAAQGTAVHNPSLLEFNLSTSSPVFFGRRYSWFSAPATQEITLRCLTNVTNANAWGAAPEALVVKTDDDDFDDTTAFYVGYQMSIRFNRPTWLPSFGQPNYGDFYPNVVFNRDSNLYYPYLNLSVQSSFVDMNYNSSKSLIVSSLFYENSYEIIQTNPPDPIDSYSKLEILSEESGLFLGKTFPLQRTTYENAEAPSEVPNYSLYLDDYEFDIVEADYLEYRDTDGNNPLFDSTDGERTAFPAPEIGNSILPCSK